MCVLAIIIGIAFSSLADSGFGFHMQTRGDEDAAIMIEQVGTLISQNQQMNQTHLEILHQAMRELCGFQDLPLESTSLSHSQVEAFGNTLAHTCDGCSESGSDDGNSQASMLFKGVTFNGGNIHLVDNSCLDPLKALYNEKNSLDDLSKDLNDISSKLRDSGSLSDPDRTRLHSIERNLTERSVKSELIMEFYKNEMHDLHQRRL